MFRFSWLMFFAICHLGLLNLAEEERRSHPSCPSSFRCGKLDRIKFPFSNHSQPRNCGVLTVDGCHRDVQMIQLDGNGSWYEIENISQSNAMFIRDRVFEDRFGNRSCETFNNLSFSRLPFLSFQIVQNVSLFKCHHPAEVLPGLDLIYSSCNNFQIYRAHELANLSAIQPNCSLIQLPGKWNPINSSNIFSVLNASFLLQVKVSPDCYQCHYSKRGECQVNNEKEFYCANATEGSGTAKIGDCSARNQRLGLKIGLGGLLVAIIALAFLYFAWRRHKQRQDSSNLFQRDSTSSRSDLEGGSVCFGISIFTYKDLEVATNNFDSEKELGDGGFGAVYYGKLRDGREVAVKRLYQHNYRRLEQFMNEVKILTRLRHKNLVSLYGCTSHHSLELLLVYEFICNGTVADHLHGDISNSNQLTWPVRMRIAIETAAALAYLHASDIVHRDVKTTNILLDSNFSVKVADFGLSRLLPTDATHVSTAPQGTPGYVDPEYHQCYQLTDKSDVYSFGVVLIELISSMPAVDITRHRSEINLTNLAINKIENSALDELIDPSLGYQTDAEVKRMTTCIARLAFQCIQQVKETRPTMEEVLGELTRIETGESKEKQDEVIDDKQVLKHTVSPASPPTCEDSALLKHVRMLPSPDSVTNRWVSSDSITPTVGGLD